MTMSAPISILTFFTFAIAGCGSGGRGSDTTPPELLTLDEGRALEIVSEVLSEAGLTESGGWSIQLATDTPLEVDVRLGSTRFGIEWLSEQDRVDLGQAVPPPAPDGQLRIAPGVGDDASAQILILDHAAYRYANERDVVQRGVPGAHETEGRLRRDLRDFLQYVRGEGGV
jgi:hypothetical protein